MRLSNLVSFVTKAGSRRRLIFLSFLFPRSTTYIAEYFELNAKSTGPFHRESNAATSTWSPSSDSDPANAKMSDVVALRT